MYSVPNKVDVPTALAISLLKRQWLPRLGIFVTNDNVRNSNLIAYNLYLKLGQDVFFSPNLTKTAVKEAFNILLEDYVFSMILPRVDRVALRFELQTSIAKDYLCCHSNDFIREHYSLKRDDFKEEHDYWRQHPEEYKYQFYSSSGGI